MAGWRDNFDWSMLFVEPPVVNAVINLLEGFYVLRKDHSPSEFLKIVFEAAEADEEPHKTKSWSQFFSRQFKSQRISTRKSQEISSNALQMIDSKNVKDIRSVRLSQKNEPRIFETDELTCSYTQICKMNVSNVERGSEDFQKPTAKHSDNHSDKYFSCTCAPEHSSSSGFDSSGTDSSDTSSFTDEEQENYDQRECSVIAEKLPGDKCGSSSLDPDKKNTQILVNNATEKQLRNKVNADIVSSTGIANKTNVVFEVFQTSIQTEDKIDLMPLNLKIPGVDQKQPAYVKNNSESIQGKEKVTPESKHFENGIYAKAKSVGQPKITTNNENNQNISDSVVRNDEHKPDKVIESMREVKAEVADILFPEYWACQEENRPEVCAMHPETDREKIFNSCQPIQSKPDRFCVNVDDKYLQAIIKLFLHILDYEEIITISLQAFKKCTETYIAFNIPFFQVITYLLLFNLNSCNFNGTKNNLTSVNTKRCFKYLKFLLSDAYKKCYDKLLTVYDHDFVISVHDRLQGSLLKQMRQEIQEVVDKLKSTRFQKKETTSRFRKLSFREPDPSTRKIEVIFGPEPSPIVHAHPVPETTYKPPQHRFYKNPKEYRKEKIQKVTRKHKSPLRESADLRLHPEQIDQISPDSKTPLACEGCLATMSPTVLPHQCSKVKAKFLEGLKKGSTTKRQQNLMKTDYYDSKITIDGSKPMWKYSRPLPNFSKVAIPVKSTASSVLREGARFRSNEQRTLQKLEWIASGGADYSAMEALWERRRLEEQQEELEAIERKHLRGLLSREEALVARRNMLCKQRQRGLNAKREREELEKQLEVFRKQEEEKIRSLVEKTHNIEAAARERPKEMQKLKSETVQKMIRESKEKMAKIQKEREAELMQRINLMRECRALQGLTKMKHKEIDFTECAGFGLMYEMSIAELNERLNMLRQELQEEVERKRAKAQVFRAQMKQHVQETQEYINQQRQKRTPDVYTKPNQSKNKKMVESEELRQLRERLNETRKLRLSAICESEVR